MNDVFWTSVGIGIFAFLVLTGLAILFKELKK